jgi:hypothetical protein
MILNSTSNPNICSCNYAFIRGSSAAGAGKTTRGFYFWTSDQVSCIGNACSIWTHTGASNAGWESTGTSNLYLGNIGLGITTSASVGTAQPDQVAYNINTSTPRADMNLALGF